MSLTTNGIGLKRTAAALKAAGLDRVNVSLDTLRPDVFKTLTRRDRHKDVLDGLEAARDAGLTPVKVNSVLMPGLNDDEAPDLLAWAVEHDYELRFIEQMPLDAQHGWKRDGMITAGDILTSLRTRFTLTAEGDDERGSAPAERWLVDGGPHRVGVIASVTRPFCRGLRPHPAHRRRPGPHLPVRPRGDRPARRAALRTPRTRRSPASGGWRCGARRRAQAWTTRRSSSRTARCRRSAAEPADRCLGVPESSSHSSSVTTSFRNPRTPRNCDRCSRCSSHASQVLRRSGVCSFGLFQASTQTASARQPLAEQIGGVGRRRGRSGRSHVDTSAQNKATPSSHGGSCPASVCRSDGGCGARTKYVTGSRVPVHRNFMIDLSFS